MKNAFGPWRLLVKLPDVTVLDAQGVAWVQAQLAGVGPITILPGHAPLLAETVTAPLHYRDGSGVHSLLVDAGVLRVQRGQVVVYTTAASQTASGKYDA